MKKQDVIIVLLVIAVALGGFNTTVWLNGKYEKYVAEKEEKQKKSDDMARQFCESDGMTKQREKIWGEISSLKVGDTYTVGTAYQARAVTFGGSSPMVSQMYWPSVTFKVIEAAKFQK